MDGQKLLIDVTCPTNFWTLLMTSPSDPQLRPTSSFQNISTVKPSICLTLPTSDRQQATNRNTSPLHVRPVHHQSSPHYFWQSFLHIPCWISWKTPRRWCLEDDQTPCEGRWRRMLYLWIGRLQWFSNLLLSGSDSSCICEFFLLPLSSVHCETSCTRWCEDHWLGSDTHPVVWGLPPLAPLTHMMPCCLVAESCALWSVMGSGCHAFSVDAVPSHSDACT